MVKIYSSYNCAKCKTIKYFLDKSHIPYSEIFFEDNPGEFPLNFMGRFPWVQIGDRIFEDTAPLTSILQALTAIS